MVDVGPGPSSCGALVTMQKGRLQFSDGVKRVQVGIVVSWYPKNWVSPEGRDVLGHDWCRQSTAFETRFAISPRFPPITPYNEC